MPGEVLTAEQRAADIYSNSLDEDHIAAAIRAAEEAAAKEAYRRGLWDAEQAVLAPWNDLGDRPSSPPAAVLRAATRIRNLPEKPKETP